MDLAVPKNTFSAKESLSCTDEEKIQALLTAPPFSHLPVMKPGDPLLATIKKYEFKEGDHIIYKGDAIDTRVYILAEGQVILGDVANPAKTLESFVSAYPLVSAPKPFFPPKKQSAHLFPAQIIPVYSVSGPQSVVNLVSTT
jgi:hypothetical protein